MEKQINPGERPGRADKPLLLWKLAYLKIDLRDRYVQYIDIPSNNLLLMSLASLLAWREIKEVVDFINIDFFTFSNAGRMLRY